MSTLTVAAAAPPSEPRALTYLHAFGALFARDIRVLRRGLRPFVLRTVTQPLLFVFVFAFVLPRIGQSGGGSPGFSTVLVPGLVASGLVLQGILAVTAPLVMELSYTREIEDRAMAPIPAWALGLEKIVAGAAQALVAAVVVFPCVLLVHAKGQAPSVDYRRWALLIVVLLASCLFTAAFGLWIGTVMEPTRLTSLFAVVMVPITMLGCVYYPWSALHSVRWLQIVVLANPMVYVSEGLRAALTPNLPHLPLWVVIPVLLGGALAAGAWSLRLFAKRLVD
ncbi:MAG: ABC transporter permease [Actinocrinis sp.]